MKAMININFRKNNEIRVFPGQLRVDRGDCLRFVLTGDPNTRVTIRGKDADSKWITDAWEKGTKAAKQSGDKFIDIPIDPNLDIPEELKEKTYAYDIEVAGVGTLDPEVTIRR